MTIKAPTNTRIYRVVGLSLIFSLLATICIFFISTLFQDKSFSDKTLRYALIAAGIGITISSLILWVLDVLSIIKLRQGWAKLIWAGLVVSLLGSSAIAFSGFYKEQSKQTSLRCIRYLEPNSSAHSANSSTPRIRQNIKHSKKENIKLFIAIDGLGENSNGDYDANIIISIEDRRHGFSRFASYPITGRKSLRSESLKEARAKYATVAPECISDKTEIVTPSLENGASDFSVGAYTLRATVFDNTLGTFGSADLPIAIITEQSAAN